MHRRISLSRVLDGVSISCEVFDMRPSLSGGALEYAMKLLASRDMTVAQLREKLVARFGEVPDDLVPYLVSKGYLNDRRFAENYVFRRARRGPLVLREELLSRGVSEPIADAVIAAFAWPSLETVVSDEVERLHLRLPLNTRDASRLFRSLCRLGYDEESVRGEIERLHEG